MDKDTLMKKVGELIGSVLSSKKQRAEIQYLQQALALSHEQILAAWILWDTKKQTYSNEVYSSDALRLVMHLHNYLEGSWHEKRQIRVLDYLQRIKAKKICDVGFGTPQKYVRSFLEKPGTGISLMDFEEFSLSFAEKVLDYWNQNWRKNIALGLFDMNRDELPKGFDSYLFQDSIEHANDPTGVLRRYVEQVPKGTNMLFSLPIEIENPVPEHNIYWKNEEEIMDWLKQAGLSILAYETIRMEKQVDLFSLFLHPDFREVVLLTRK